MTGPNNPLRARGVFRARSAPPAFPLVLILALILALILTGCSGDTDADVIIRDCDGGCYYEATVSGTAYFPYYERGETVYYDDANEEILVELRDELGYIVSDTVTGPSGYFRFDDLPAGWYYLTAVVEVYDPDYDLWDVYVAEQSDFYVDAGAWVSERNLFLEYSYSGR